MADENVLDDNISTIDQAVMVGKHESIFNFENKSSGDIGESINRLFIKKVINWRTEPRLTEPTERVVKSRVLY